MSSLLEAPEHVLSTLEKDGSRRWLSPRLSKGHYWRMRRLVGYSLITLFLILPHLRIAGKPALLLDVMTRHFTFFGMTFLPTDTLLLALFMVSVFLSIFLATAVLGRIWCGWGCPQTVYLEFVFRPLERLFSGTVGQGGPAHRKTAIWKRIARFAVYLVVSAVLAHTFLAYFVGTDRLRVWLTQSPFEHVAPFLVMALTMVLMLFDFAYFREQLCLVACPYGRFQSVLLDRQSLIVAYDRKRGEPRGRKKDELPIVNEQPRTGDCIDCGLCVRTCPTGIDIRDGLQMECVHCTQCIDACDEIMDRVERPRGLIRYACQAEIDGQPRQRMRPRLVIYPLLLTVVIGTLVVMLMNRPVVDITVLRTAGNPYTVTENGRVQNTLKMKLVNRSDKSQTITIRLADRIAARLDDGADAIELAAGETVTRPMLISAEKSAFQVGRLTLELHVKTAAGWERTTTCQLLGP